MFIVALKSEGQQSFRLEERDKCELMCIVAQKLGNVKSSDQGYSSDAKRYSGSDSRSESFYFVGEVAHGN